MLVRWHVEGRRVHLHGKLFTAGVLLGREGEVHGARNLLGVGDSEVGLDAAGREHGLWFAVLVERRLGGRRLTFLVARQVGEHGPEGEHLVCRVKRVRLEHGRIQGDDELVLLEDAPEVLRGDARYDALARDGVDDAQRFIRRVPARDVEPAQFAEHSVVLSLEHNLDDSLLARFDGTRGGFENKRAESQLAALSLGRRHGVTVLVLLNLGIRAAPGAVVEEVKVKGEVSHVGNLERLGLGLGVVHRGAKVNPARRREGVLGVRRPDGNLDRDLVVSNAARVDDGEVQIPVVHQVHLALDLALAGHALLNLDRLVEVKLDRNLGARFDLALGGFDGEEVLGGLGFVGKGKCDGVFARVVQRERLLELRVVLLVSAQETKVQRGDLLLALGWIAGVLDVHRDDESLGGDFQLALRDGLRRPFLIREQGRGLEILVLGALHVEHDELGVHLDRLCGLLGDERHRDLVLSPWEQFALRVRDCKLRRAILGWELQLPPERQRRGVLHAELPHLLGARDDAVKGEPSLFVDVHGHDRRRRDADAGHRKLKRPRVVLNLRHDDAVVDRERARASGERGYLHVLGGGLLGVAILGLGLALGGLALGRWCLTVSRGLALGWGLFAVGGGLRLGLGRPLVFALGVGGDDELARLLSEQRHLLRLKLENVEPGYGQIAGFLELVPVVVHRPLQPKLDLDVVQTVVGDPEPLDVGASVVRVRVHGARIRDRVALRVLRAFLPRRRRLGDRPLVQQRSKLKLPGRLFVRPGLGDDELVRDEVVGRALRRLGLLRRVHVAVIVGDCREVASSDALERLNLLSADAFKREVLGEIADFGGFEPHDDLHRVARWDVPPGERLHIVLRGCFLGGWLGLGLGTLGTLDRLRRRRLLRVWVFWLDRRREHGEFGRGCLCLPLRRPRDDLEHLLGRDVVEGLGRGGHRVLLGASRDVDDGARVVALVGEDGEHQGAVVGVRRVRRAEEREDRLDEFAVFRDRRGGRLAELERLGRGSLLALLALGFFTLGFRGLLRLGLRLGLGLVAPLLHRLALRRDSVVNLQGDHHELLAAVQHEGTLLGLGSLPVVARILRLGRRPRLGLFHAQRDCERFDRREG